MFRIIPNIKSENRVDISGYLQQMYRAIITISDSVNDKTETPAVQARFQSHISSEEERLRRNLDRIRYYIDAADIVPLVTGPGPIERVRFGKLISDSS